MIKLLKKARKTLPSIKEALMIKLLKKARNVFVSFVRQEEGRVTTIAIVQFKTRRPEYNEETLVQILKNALTAWVKQTVRGRKAWDYTGGDFNIGDVGSGLQTQDIKKIREVMALEGVDDFDIVYIGDPSHSVPFDTVLVQRELLDIEE
jgi:hypothetical protein